MLQDMVGWLHRRFKKGKATDRDEAWFCETMNGILRIEAKNEPCGLENKHDSIFGNFQHFGKMFSVLGGGEKERRFLLLL